MNMKRNLPYITVGRILAQLHREGLSITRASFYRLEKRLDLPSGKRTSAKNQWRVYSPYQAEQVMKRLKKEYNYSII